MAIHDVICNSLVTSFDAAYHETRRERIQEIVPATRRTAALMIHDATVRFPKAAAFILGFDLEAMRTNYVGAGADAIVLKESAAIP